MYECMYACKIMMAWYDIHTYIHTYIHTQAAHAEVLETSLRQERELQQLPPLRRQLDTYKAGESVLPTYLHIHCPHFYLYTYIRTYVHTYMTCSRD